MKRNDKIVFTIGFILLAFASFFAIGLIMPFLYIGTATQKFIILSYAIGELLISVYGFSSTLIPVYLLVGSLLCFIPHWTRRKGIYFVSSIIPLPILFFKNMIFFKQILFKTRYIIENLTLNNIAHYNVT